MHTQQYDIAIIGGGPVGSALARALRASELNVCVLEARPAQKSSQDARALALSYGSKLLLSRLGVWDDLCDVSAIRSIHISQKGSFGRTLIQAEDLGVSELGYVLPYSDLQEALSLTLLNCPSPAHGSGGHNSSSTSTCNIDSICGASVTQLHSNAGCARISYLHDGSDKEITARVAVVADGGKLLESRFPPDVHDYEQTALIAHVTCSEPRYNTAFERFTSQGPLALLPYKGGYELVWTAPSERAREISNWDDARFLRALNNQFGERVGEFLSVSTRTGFPLVLKRAPLHSPLPHTVLLGNAAQTMHPVAGQGFNLGLRDAWDLSQAILDALPDALGTEVMLADYHKRRRIDREAAIKFTDGLVKLFSNDIPMINAGRAAALTALDCLPFAKKFVAKRMMFGANG